MLRRRAAIPSIALCALLAGCSGSLVTAPRGPVPPTTLAPGAVTLSRSSLSFTAVGSANAQAVDASQANNSGSFAASTAPSGQSGSCNGIATISPSSGTSFTVTAVAAGHCAFSIVGGNGNSATLTIDVTTTSVGGS